MVQKQLIADRPGFQVLFGNKKSQAATMVLDPGESTGGPHNKHEKSDQWLFVLGGTGLAKINGTEHPLTEDTLILIEAGEPHEIISKGDEPLRTLNFYTPPEY